MILAEFNGFDDLEDKFRQLSEEQIQEAMMQGMRKCTQLVQGAAKGRVNVHSGALRNSIYTDVEQEGDTVTGIVYTNMKYAPYIEFGTGPKGAANHEGISPDVAVAYSMSPWWIHEGPGENEVDSATAERYGWSHADTPAGRFYRCSGNPAYPFMYPALKDNEEACVKLFRHEYERMLT